MAVLIRNTVQARGQEGIDFLLNDMLPKVGCPPEMAQELVNHLRTQQSRDFRKTFTSFIRAMKA
jgi:exportin-T